MQFCANILIKALVRLALATAATAMAGCASIGTNSVTGQRANVGQPYFLPKAEFVVALGAPATNNATLAFDVAMIADTDAGQLHLHRNAGVLSSDTVDVKVGDNQLLTSVSTTFDSRAPEIATGLGEIIGRLEGAVGANVLTSDSFDPTTDADRAAAAGRLSLALSDWAIRERRLLTAQPTAASRLAATPSATDRAQAEATDLKRVNRLAFLEEAARAAIGLDWSWEGAAPSPGGSTASANCKGSICVRAPRPGRLRVFRCLGDTVPPTACSASSGGVLVATFRANIPNDAPSSSIPVYGGVFADVTHTLVLSNGVLQSHKSVRSNELEGLVTSVGNLLGGIVKGVVDGVSGEQQIIEAQTKRINAQTARLEAQAKLDDASKDSNQNGTSDPTGMESALSESAVWVGLFGPAEVKLIEASSEVPSPTTPQQSSGTQQQTQPQRTTPPPTGAGQPSTTTEGSPGEKSKSGG